MDQIIEKYSKNLYAGILEKDDITTLKELVSTGNKPIADNFRDVRSKEAAFIILDHVPLCDVETCSDNQRIWLREYIVSNTNKFDPNIFVNKKTEPLWHYIRVFTCDSYSEQINVNIKDKFGKTYLHKLELSQNDDEFFKLMPNPFIKEKNGSLPSKTNQKIKEYENAYFEYLIDCERKLLEIQKIFGVTAKALTFEFLDETDIQINKLMLEHSTDNVVLIRELLTMCDNTSGKYNKIKIATVIYEKIDEKLIRNTGFRKMTAKKIKEMREQIQNVRCDRFQLALDKVEKLIASIIPDTPDTPDVLPCC